jgi:sarcosine oxidase subunit beta
MSRYSGFKLLREALRGNSGWSPAWADARPKSSYDAVVIGGGGHGLATAYYLAKKHGMRRVAVLERGAIGLGNSGRNTQVVRSNYFYPVSCAFFDHSLKLYEGLSRELNFNLMLSQRGVLNLAHSEHDMEMQRRWCNAIRMSGIDSEMLSPDEIQTLVPILSLQGAIRFLAALSSVGPGFAGTMRWFGATHGRQALWASTSSRTARSPGL